MALVLQSRVSSCPGNPLTLLRARLLPGPKEAAHTTADRAVDTAGVQHVGPQRIQVYLSNFTILHGVLWILTSPLEGMAEGSSEFPAFVKYAAGSLYWPSSPERHSGCHESHSASLP